MLNLSRFERYRELIDDWDAFSDALHRPLPACMWTNTLRTTPRVLSEWLERCGVAHAPLSWLPEAFVIHDPEHAHALGATFPYLAGLGHVQEEVSLIPSFLLGATRGERVLDTCAAPGGKTVHIAIQMDNAGTVVANDKSYQRLRAVRSISNRLGVFNIAMTNIDACNMPNAMGRFDRALVDVPCSCEGTSRKNHGVLEDQTNPEVFARVQRRILARALKLLRPGGRLVYSTCTYAPEENELVLQRVLSEFGWERARIISPDRELAGLRLTPGLTTWRGEELHPDMARTLRVWPHHNDTGGFFVAVLERVLDDDHAQVIERAFDPHTHDAHLEPEAEHWEKVRQWFGLGDRWEGARRIYRSNTRLLSLVHTPHEPPTKPAP
ncbi:MAG: RsmB/NOP family class I SAM-dependent RNA methyltransferase, partial [Myxococcota bacterium]